ncbi:MAG: DUF4238 domain-containing protein [Anaerolineaceae bacterium]
MKTKKTHKKQHLIPESYLINWADEKYSKGKSIYVWVFNRDNLYKRRLNPRNVFIETEAYTIFNDEGERDLLLENKLNIIEGVFANVFHNKIERFNFDFTDINDRVIVSIFVASMMARTTKKREKHKEFWKDVLDLSDKWIEWEKSANKKQLENVDSTHKCN